MVVLSIIYLNKKKTKISIFLVIGIVCIAVDLFSGQLMTEYLLPSKIDPSIYFNIRSVGSIIGLIGIVIIATSYYFIVFIKANSNIEFFLNISR